MKGIKGSGPNGRIVAKDLEGVEPQAAAAAPAAAAATAGAAPSATASYEDIPITSMRKTIASRLLQSPNNPHHTLFNLKFPCLNY